MVTSWFLPCKFPYAQITDGKFKKTGARKHSFSVQPGFSDFSSDEHLMNLSTKALNWQVSNDKRIVIWGNFFSAGLFQQCV